MADPFLQSSVTPQGGRAVVGGCGRSGAAVAVALSELGCRVRVIDIIPSAFDHLPEERGQAGVLEPLLGDITLESDLRLAGVQDCNIFIAVTGNDSVNIMAAQIAQHILQIPTVICRLDDPVKRDLYEQLELVTISHTHMLRDLAVQALNGPRHTSQSVVG